MANNFRKSQSRTEKLQKNTENSPSLWDISPEKEQENIDKVKKQWEKKQHQKFTRIRYEELQNKNIKVIVSSLVSITLIVVAFPFITNWWKMGQNVIIESSSEETAEDGSEKGGFLNKLNDLQKKQKKEANSSESKKEKTTIGEQLEKSVDNIDKHNSELKKAIELSDGK
jgi:hypothetical protein